MDFDEFWRHYPRKVAKGAARRAWFKAIRIASPADIAADLVRAKWRDDPQFIPHPATWLNAERWLDENPEATPLQSPQNLAGAIAEFAGKLPDVTFHNQGVRYLYRCPLGEIPLLIDKVLQDYAGAAGFPPTMVRLDFETVIEWLHAGIPYTKIANTIRSAAERWRASRPDEPIRSFRFFDHAVRAIGPAWPYPRY